MYKTTNITKSVPWLINPKIYEFPLLKFLKTTEVGKHDLKLRKKNKKKIFDVLLGDDRDSLARNGNAHILNLHNNSREK